MEALKLLREEADRKRKAAQEAAASKVRPQRHTRLLFHLVRTLLLSYTGQEVHEKGRLGGTADEERE